MESRRAPQIRQEQCQFCQIANQNRAYAKQPYLRLFVGVCETRKFASEDKGKPFCPWRQTLSRISRKFPTQEGAASSAPTNAQEIILLQSLTENYWRTKASVPPRRESYRKDLRRNTYLFLEAYHIAYYLQGLSSSGSIRHQIRPGCGGFAHISP